MTPNEKAKELIESFMPLVESFSEQQQLENAKKCAEISINESIEVVKMMAKDFLSADYFPFTHLDRLNQIKQEIKNYQP